MNSKRIKIIILITFLASPIWSIAKGDSNFRLQQNACWQRIFAYQQSTKLYTELLGGASRNFEIEKKIITLKDPDHLRILFARGLNGNLPKELMNKAKFLLLGQGIPIYIFDSTKYAGTIERELTKILHEIKLRDQLFKSGNFKESTLNNQKQLVQDSVNKIAFNNLLEKIGHWPTYSKYLPIKGYEHSYHRSLFDLDVFIIHQLYLDPENSKKIRSRILFEAISENISIHCCPIKI